MPIDRSERATSQRVAEWIRDVNGREIPDRPLRWVDGRYHCAASLAHVWAEEHDDELSVQQMAAALTTIRDNPEEFGLDVEYRLGSDNVGRWQVYKGVFASAD